MHARKLLIVAAFCCATPANASDCSDLYGAIKQAAMYCGFFCDQRELIPLQRAYESNCIAIVVPLNSLSFEDQSNELLTNQSTEPHSDRQAVALKPFSSRLLGAGATRPLSE